MGRLYHGDCSGYDSKRQCRGQLGPRLRIDVTSGTNCVYSDTNGGGIQFWDIQAGGTYTVTLSGVDDAANQGMDPTMKVIVHNSVGGNICATATKRGSMAGTRLRLRWTRSARRCQSNTAR